MQTTPKQKSKIPAMLGALAVVMAMTLVSAIGLVKAFQSQKAQTVFENAQNVTVNNQGDTTNVASGGDVFGQASFNTTTADTISDVNDLNVRGCIRQQNSTTSEGLFGVTDNAIWDCFVMMPLDYSTYTLALWDNNQGRNVYVYDAGIILTALPTTTTRFAIATTTANGHVVGATGIVTAITENGRNTIMDGISVVPGSMATNTTLWLANYPGTAYPENHNGVAMVAPDNQIACVASSTDIQVSALRGSCFLRFHLIDD